MKTAFLALALTVALGATSAMAQSPFYDERLDDRTRRRNKPVVDTDPVVENSALPVFNKPGLRATTRDNTFPLAGAYNPYNPYAYPWYGAPNYVPPVPSVWPPVERPFARTFPDYPVTPQLGPTYVPVLRSDLDAQVVTYDYTPGYTAPIQTNALAPAATGLTVRQTYPAATYTGPAQQTNVSTQRQQQVVETETETTIQYERTIEK